MIEYEPRERTRTCDTLTALRKMANSPELNAEQLNARLAREVRAVKATMRLIHGGKWSSDINHDACLVSVARDWC